MPSPDFNFDTPQDAQLRSVSVPHGLLAKLRLVALADDEGLDAAIREVPLPEGLLGHLRQPVLLTDEGLDAALREVPLPLDLSVRLQRVPKRWKRLARLTQWAAAASLVIAIGLSYSGAMIGFLISAYPYAGEGSRSEPALSLTAELPRRPEPEFDAVISPGAAQPPQDPFARSLSPVPPVDWDGLQRPRRRPLAELNELFEGSRGDDMFLDVELHRWGVLTAHRQFDDLPELKLVAGLIPRGIDWPVVPGSNPHILLRYGVHPFVSPASHPKLRSVLVPLDVDASSYELTRRYLEDGRLPPPDVVRTEEFLSAVDFKFARPKRGPLELSTAAGPSPFGVPGLRLMQIGVQARQLQPTTRRPTHVIVAADISASMRWGGRLEMIRRQLGELVRRLGPDDRISLVTFSEEAVVLAEEAGREEAEGLLAVIEPLAAQSSTNVGAGLRQAFAVARRSVALPPTAARVVLLTDGLAEFAPDAAEKIQERLAEAAGRGIHLHVIDMGQEDVPDSLLAGFAQSGLGKVYRATNGDQLRWALLEIVSGQSQLIAADARLKVTFHPKAVLEYRLLGHEAKAMAGLMPAHPEADLHAGQSATALYELRLAPRGPQEVATVELTWRQPGRGDRDSLTRIIRRREFGSSFVEVPLSLQEAALVAEMAEVLRQSPYTPNPWAPPSLGLSGVLQVAGQVDTRLYQRPTFVDFVSLLEQAAKAKRYRER